MGGTLRFGILGPLEVVDDEPLRLGGPKQRAVLAVLLLHRRNLVATDRLIEELWGGKAPATAGKTVQVYVSNLRKALGDGVLITRGRGYLLDAGPGQVDADQFEQLAHSGRQALEKGQTELARERLRSALGLWRGPPLADFASEEFAQSEITRLDEARLVALEDRIEAELALGQHLTLVPEIEAFARTHPLRERLYAQLMLALYRAGRQADALARYQQARRMLIDEFALEPSPQLKEMQRAILNQDPTLQLPAPTASAKRRPARLLTAKPTRASATAAPTAVARSSRSAADAPELRSEDRRRAQTLGRRATELRTSSAARIARWRRAIDARWSERRLLIAASAGLVLVAVIVVALLASIGGSSSRPHGSAATCSGCLASISAPAPGGGYKIGQLVATRFACSGPGLLSCDDSTGTATARGGEGHIDTSTLGQHSYVVTATYKGGLSRVSKIPYTVVGPVRAAITTAAAAVVRRHTAVTLRCTGGLPGETCRGGVWLIIIRRVGRAKMPLSIAYTPYSMLAGATETITLRVVRAGIVALRRVSGHHRHAEVLVTVKGAGATRRAIPLRLG